jgi:hypothetical protein
MQCTRFLAVSKAFRRSCPREALLPRTNIDRFLPTWFFPCTCREPLGPPARIGCKVGARSDPVYHMPSTCATAQYAEHATYEVTLGPVVSSPPTASFPGNSSKRRLAPPQLHVGGKNRGCSSTSLTVRHQALCVASRAISRRARALRSTAHSMTSRPAGCPVTTCNAPGLTATDHDHCGAESGTTADIPVPALARTQNQPSSARRPA